MEVLILLAMVFVELVVGIMIPMIVVAGEIVGTVFAVAVQFLLRFTVGRQAETQTPPRPVIQPPSATQAEPAAEAPVVTAGQRTAVLLLWRRFAMACVVLSAISLVALLLANFLLFESVVRFAANRVAGRSGIEIRFDSASGNLLTGHLNFRGLEVARSGHPNSNYDVRLDECDLQLSALSVLRQERKVQRIDARGLKGTFERLAPNDDRARKPFLVEHLSISNASIDVTDHTPPGGEANLKLALDSFVVDDYESQWAVRDVLFTSQTHGNVDGGGFTIASNATGVEQSSEWNAERLAVPLVVTYLGGPFRVFKEGEAKVSVTNKWNGGSANPKIDMHWRIVFDGLKAGIPDNAAPGAAKLLEPFVGNFTLQEGPFPPLDFHVVIEQQAFQGKGSLEAIGLKNIVRESAIRTLEEKTGFNYDEIADRVKDAAENMKQAAKGAGDRIRNARKAGKGIRERMKKAFGRDKDRNSAETEPDKAAASPESSEDSPVPPHPPE